MGNGGQEECGAKPDLARLALLTPTEHGYDCREEKQRCQTGLDRSDAPSQTAVVQKPKERPYDGRGRKGGRGAQGACPRAVLPSSAEGVEKNRRCQGLGKDP